MVNPIKCIFDWLLPAALCRGIDRPLAFTAGERIGLLRRYEIFSFGCPPALEAFGGENPADVRRRFEAALDRVESSDPRFCGLAGFFSYEAGQLFEPCAFSTPTPASALLCKLLRVDCAYVFDRLSGSGSIVFARGALSERRRDFADCIRALLESTPLQPDSTHAEIPFTGPSALGEFSPDEYCRRVAQIRERIFAGDFYECNFTQRFRLSSPTCPEEAAVRVFRACPAPHRAYFDFGDLKLISASPELFLECSAGMIRSRPIKGSTARARDQHEDRARQERLRRSPKERAEHTMVVDLARNDLGRICRPGSVRVPQMYCVDSFPSVHHLVSTVEGKLLPEVPMWKIFEAAFPAASITGAPKIQVMRTIEQLEVSPRGAYTGAIGHFAPGGGFDLNVAIRTIEVREADGGYLYTAGSGGAVVADSVPEEEYEECLMKVRPLLNCIAPECLTYDEQAG